MSAPGKTAAQPAADVTGLVGLIDKLEKLLNASELTELEVEVGETALVLRKPGAFAASAESSVATAGSVTPVPTASAPGPATAVPKPEPAMNAIVAPLTGLFYASPSPGAEPYVKPGAQVLVGQVIGLIEAMKLFNEIKSDRAGRVVRVVPEDGALVKAKDPLIEVQP
ncbi:MAG: acetyl-CoA carboxylase biotin carboxyl carrier protein [Chloroflexota bacterium]|jgi:acetyl-CoA carboxylase biotin carboxyl carrier protein|nr:acetyl-CoA carboxylase biotin carboxyl carrier protein [Chloroflexota bacterium]